MSTPENKVKTFINKWMKTWFPDAFVYAPPGGLYGKGGMPDKLWFIKASEEFTIVVAIEAKAIGNKPTDLQLVTLTKLQRQGAIAAVVTGKDLGHLERIHAEIIRRLLLAAQKP